jgi:hypothetical protein
LQQIHASTIASGKSVFLRYVIDEERIVLSVLKMQQGQFCPCLDCTKRPLICSNAQSA